MCLVSCCSTSVMPASTLQGMDWYENRPTLSTLKFCDFLLSFLVGRSGKATRWEVPHGRFGARFNWKHSIPTLGPSGKTSLFYSYVCNCCDVCCIELQDYPSIGQIAEKLFEFDVIPIFAVVESIQNIYNVTVVNYPIVWRILGFSL